MFTGGLAPTVASPLSPTAVMAFIYPYFGIVSISCSVACRTRQATRDRLSPSPGLLLTLQLLDGGLGHVLDTDQLSIGTLDHLEEFVELEVDRPGLAVGRVLDREHHDEGDNARRGVDHQLVGVREADEWTETEPRDDDGDRKS